MKKLCILFPGIGYHVDKPLLYYSKRMMKEDGYDVFEIQYSSFPSNIFENRYHLNDVIEIGCGQVKEQMKNIDLKQYDRIVCISKSIGCAIALKYMKKNSIPCEFILYTPTANAFEYIEKKYLIFSGGADPWIDREMIIKEAEKRNLHIHLYEECNHSLERNDVIENISILEDVMKKTKEYIKRIES